MNLVRFFRQLSLNPASKSAGICHINGACKFPFYCATKLKDLVNQSPSSDKEMIDDAIKVIDSFIEKFPLYMGHICRKHSQSSQIKEREEYIRKC